MKFFSFLIDDTKSVFLAVNASLRCFTNVVCCTYSRFLASYWSAGFGGFLKVSALASFWLEDCANFTPTRRKTTNAAPTTLGTAVQCKQQANPFLSMNRSTPLLIRRYGKNKQLTLLSQRKLILTAGNTLFSISLEHLERPRFLFRPKTNHTCRQNPKPSRESVSLKIFNDSIAYLP